MTIGSFVGSKSGQVWQGWEFVKFPCMQDIYTPFSMEFLEEQVQVTYSSGSPGITEVTTHYTVKRRYSKNVPVLTTKGKIAFYFISNTL